MTLGPARLRSILSETTRPAQQVNPHLYPEDQFEGTQALCIVIRKRGLVARMATSTRPMKAKQSPVILRLGHRGACSLSLSRRLSRDNRETDGEDENTCHHSRKYQRR